MYRLSQWLRRELLTLILGAALIAVGLTFARASHGLRDLLVLRHYRDRLETEREREQTQNRELQATVAKLQSDDAFIQRTIRKELGLARSNELIYRFASDNPPASSATAP
jgi:cell division protein FtsB